jgi:hypothetical protein
VSANHARSRPSKMGGRAAFSGSTGRNSCANTPRVLSARAGPSSRPGRRERRRSRRSASRWS